MSNDLIQTKKFVDRLGNPGDFVEYLAKIEMNGNFKSLGNFESKARYLMVKNGQVPIIDFRHFFAFMGQRLYGALIDNPIFQDEATVSMIGILGELVQCWDEFRAEKYKSCFSPEDLGSNRLGIDFADCVIDQRSQNPKIAIASLLSIYLAKLEPIPAASVHELKAASVLTNFPEVVRQVFSSSLSLITPRSYYIRWVTISK